MTCSPSFLRIRPWSTKTHVSWSPTARCTSSAATDESTPPLRPQITLPVPTWARMRAICSSTIDAADHAHVAAADVAQERLEDVLPERACGRPRDGTGCRRSRRSADSNAATGDAVDDASAVKPGGRLEDRVAVRHPARLLGGQPGQQLARLADRELRAPELADLGALDAPAERQRDELHAVTDAQHRDAELEQLRVEPRRAVGVHRRRAAAEDQALRPAPRDLLGADVVGQQLAEDAALAHAPGDQLRVLAAVVEDDDLVDRARDVDRRRLVRELGRGGRLGDDPVLGHASLRAGAFSTAPFSAPGCADADAPRLPIPTPCADCSALPSVCSAGAIISSARLNSARSL